MKPYQVAHLAVGKTVGVMTGSTLVHSGDDKLIITGMKASRKYKYVEIVYDAGKDLFEMAFYAKRAKKGEYPLLKRYTDLFTEDLQNVFEQETGLYTTL